MKTQVKESVIRVHSDLVGFYFREYKMRRLMKISLNKTVTHYGLNYQKKFEKSLSIFIAYYHKESISSLPKSNLAKYFRTQKDIEAFRNFSWKRSFSIHIDINLLNCTTKTKLGVSQMKSFLL